MDKEELYTAVPKTEEEAQIQLKAIYQKLADMSAERAKKTLYITGGLFGAALISMLISILIGTGSAPVLNVIVLVCTFAGIYFGIRLYNEIMQKREALQNLDDLKKGRIQNCKERVMNLRVIFQTMEDI